MNKVIHSIKTKHLLKKYLIFIITMFLASINFNLFIKPTKIVAGGVNGLAILLEDFLHIPPSIFIFSFSIVILIIGIIFLGFTKASSILLFTIIYPFFVRLTSSFSNIIQVDNNDLIIFSIFIAITTGIVNGICYKLGFGAGPIPLLSQIIYKFTKLSLSKTTFLINTIIVLIGGYKYGLEKILYAIITIYINSIVIDKILLKTSLNKVFYIITEENSFRSSSVKKILNENNMHLKTYHTEDSKEVVIFIIPDYKYYKLKKQLINLDKNIKYIITNTYDIHKV